MNSTHKLTLLAVVLFVSSIALGYMAGERAEHALGKAHVRQEGGMLKLDRPVDRIRIVTHVTHGVDDLAPLPESIVVWPGQTELRVDFDKLKWKDQRGEEIRTPGDDGTLRVLWYAPRVSESR